MVEAITSVFKCFRQRACWLLRWCLLRHDSQLWGGLRPKFDHCFVIQSEISPMMELFNDVGTLSS